MFRFTAMFGIVTLCIIAIAALPSFARAQEDLYGPPVEFGLGLTGYHLQSGPEWTDDFYGAGVITGAVRLFRGLAAQGGFEYGYGDELSGGWLRYNDSLRLRTGRSTTIETRWYGLRYDIPLERFGVSYYHIHTVLVGAGFINTLYGMEAATVERDGTVQNIPEERYTLGEADGKYVLLAARWRFETDETVSPGAWLGSYGLDAGMRYDRYDSFESRGTLVTPEKFGSLQVFVTGFMKVNLF